MKLSIARLTSLSALLVVLGVLSAAGGVLVCINGLTTGAQQQRAASNARLAGARVETLLVPYQAAARAFAAHAAELGLLSANKLAERTAFAGLFAPALPAVLRLRLLPAGTRETDAVVPELSYACLDLLERREKGLSVPAAELHLPGTPSAHIDVSAPVTDPADGKTLLGHVLLSLDPKMLSAALAVPSTDGYAELRQVTPKGEFVVLASGGDAGLKSGEPVATHSLTNSSWRLAFWPAAAALAPSTLELGLMGTAALVTLLLLALAVAIPRRALAAALKHDVELLGTLFNDVRTGVLMGQYPFRLQELGELAQPLRVSGAAMIEDRRNLEKLTRSDALTGLASRPVFNQKLEQLHQQARQGFSSALLVTDIDHLEEINTQLGPDAGDILLKQFARQLRDTLRQSDVVARLEGGRFAVLFPFTDLEKITPVVERLRIKLAEEFDPGSGMPRAYSWSAGLTLLGANDTEAEAAVTRAEAAIALARQEGGNRTVIQALPA